jgi:hypothetical protein
MSCRVYEDDGCWLKHEKTLLHVRDWFGRNFHFREFRIAVCAKSSSRSGDTQGE